MRCATHPAVETYLTCATCGKPICPDCMVETPAGMKCRDDGLAPLPRIYRVPPGRLAAVIAVGAALGAATSALVLTLRTGFGLFLIFFAPIAGGVIAEAAGRSSGGKRGPLMAIATAASCAVGMLLGPQVLALLAGVSISLLDGVAVLLRRPFILFFLGLTVVVAFWRVR